MCGFTGFWSPPEQWGGDTLPILHRMTSTIRHRGPDDSGVACVERVGLALGFRRLAILDLSAEGHQPMSSGSDRYLVVYNGEAYNFLELRRDLEARGTRFRGHSDTEVLLAGFDCWGIVPTIKRVVGMFAMAIWDNETRSLHLVRDRTGEKPLYYGYLDDTLVFGSELKALRAHPAWHGRIDRGALSLYLRFMCIPTPYSIYEGIRKVVPGTILTCRRGEPPTVTTYWSAREMVESATRERLTGSLDELATECETVLRTTIGQQMIADVPLGAFLSGGIDSSLIVSLMQTQSTIPVRTFTIGFGEQQYNEAAHAKAVAQHLGTQHTELYVSPSDAIAVVPKLPGLYDEPFADSSQIPTFLVASLARGHVGVSLSGDGGDELFGGYNRYFWGPRIAAWLRWVPRPVRTGAAHLLRALPPNQWDSIFEFASPAIPASARMRMPGDRLHKLAGLLSTSGEADLYRYFVSHWIGADRFGLGDAEPATMLTDTEAWPATETFTDRMMFLDLVTYLRDDILVKVDRATMGVSLESRAPFLDHRVIEFAWRLPREAKVDGRQGKILLRHLLARYVPTALTDRPKMGFGVPIDSWLRGPMRDWAESLLDAARLDHEGFFNTQEVRSRWREHLDGRNWQHALWTVLMFQAWHEAQAST